DAATRVRVYHVVALARQVLELVEERVAELRLWAAMDVEYRWVTASGHGVRRAHDPRVYADTGGILDREGFGNRQRDAVEIVAVGECELALIRTGRCGHEDFSEMRRVARNVGDARTIVAHRTLGDLRRSADDRLRSAVLRVELHQRGAARCADVGDEPAVLGAEQRAATGAAFFGVGEHSVAERVSVLGNDGSPPAAIKTSARDRRIPSWVRRGGVRIPQRRAVGRPNRAVDRVGRKRNLAHGAAGGGHDVDVAAEEVRIESAI